MHFKAYLAFIILVFSTLIISHQRSESYSRIDIKNEENLIIEIDFNVQISVLSRIKSSFEPSWESKLQKEVLNNYKVKGSCELDQDIYFRSSLTTGYVSLKWMQICEKEPVEIDYNLFFEEDPTHVHIATISINEQPYPEKIFTVASKNWNESSALNKEESSVYSSFYDYLEMGVSHILSGLDHIAFLLGLLLINLKRKNLIIVITGFTLGHSITLALAALGFVKLQLSVVEPLIFLSIVWVAVENTLFEKTTKWRPFVVFCFGVLHGLGFGTLLTQYGLPKENFISLLLAFNVGVEFGQLSVLLMAFILVRIIFMKTKYKNQLKIPASGLIGLTGLYWFIESLI